MTILCDDAPTLQLSALPTGTLYLPDRWLFEDGAADVRKNRQFSPDYSFLIQHPSGKRVLFDLGLRKDLENNPKVIKADYSLIEPTVTEDVVDILAKGGLEPSDIDSIILSHLHFDHVGDCTRFPNSDIIIGPGSHAATTPGWPKEENSPFLSCVLDHPKMRELELRASDGTPSDALPFRDTLDFFGDGSLILMSTPGHMPGHLGAVAHTGPDEWIFLGGDCCHHRALLLDRRPMSVTFGPNGTKSFHADPVLAAQTISNVRKLDADPRVFVALPHDASLMGVIPLFPASLSNWKDSDWKRRLDEKVATLYP